MVYALVILLFGLLIVFPLTVARWFVKNCRAEWSAEGLFLGGRPGCLDAGEPAEAIDAHAAVLGSRGYRPVVWVEQARASVGAVYAQVWRKEGCSNIASIVAYTGVFPDRRRFASIGVIWTTRMTSGVKIITSNYCHVDAEGGDRSPLMYLPRCRDAGSLLKVHTARVSSAGGRAAAPVESDAALIDRIRSDAAEAWARHRQRSAGRGKPGVARVSAVELFREFSAQLSGVARVRRWVRSWRVRDELSALGLRALWNSAGPAERFCSAREARGAQGSAAS